MKARIRKTGEIVDIITFSCSTNRNRYDTVSYIDSKGVEHENFKAGVDWYMNNMLNEALDFLK